MKDSWQGYALATIVAFLLGGGASTLYSKSALADLRETHEEDVAALKTEQEQDLDVLLNIIDGIARLETEIRYIKEKVDER